MKPVIIAALAILLVGARCNVPGELGPCGAYRKSCGDSLGGCCGEEDDCVPDGCEYRGRDTTLGAERTVKPRIRP